MSDREEFENVMYSRGRTDIDLRTDAYSADSDYVIPSVQECWEVWQAARESEGGEALSNDDVMIQDYARCLSLLGVDLDCGEDIPMCLGDILAEMLSTTPQPDKWVPYGWKLVPVEPNQWMRTQGEEGMDDCSVKEVWRRMINAAPAPPEQESE